MKASTNSTFHTKTDFEPSISPRGLTSEKRWSSITNWSRAALYLTMANQRKNFDGKIAMNLNFAAEGLAQKLNIKINKYCICLREEKVTWVVSTSRLYWKRVIAQYRGWTLCTL